jgi:hypothetical protein
MRQDCTIWMRLSESVRMTRGLVGGGEIEEVVGGSRFGIEGGGDPPYSLPNQAKSYAYAKKLAYA